jgi:hypothetical protein
MKILESEHFSPHDDTTHRVNWRTGLVTVWPDDRIHDPNRVLGSYHIDPTTVPSDFVPHEYCFDCEEFQPGHNCTHAEVLVEPA